MSRARPRLRPAGCRRSRRATDGVPRRARGDGGRGGARGVGGRGPLVDAAPLRRHYFELVLADGRDVVRLPRRAQRALVPAAGLSAADAPYVELHAHSAFSFLDGASTPTELAAAAAALGYPALALTDHDGLWGSMEFAHACRGLGVRPITGAELTVASASPASRLAHLTLLVETAAGYRNLCRLLTAAHSHTRDGPQRRGRAAVGRRWSRSRSTPRASSASPAAPATGSLAGALGARRAAAGGARSAPAARRLRARAPPGRAAAALLAPRPRPQPLAGRARRAARRALRRDRQRPLPPPLAAPASRTPSSPSALGPALEESEPRRRGNRSSALASPRGMARALRRAPRGGRRDACGSPSGCASTSPPSSATATRAPRTTGADRELAEVCRARLDERYAGSLRSRARPSAGSRRSWRRSATSASPASSSSTATCSSWPARSRSRCAGRARPGRCCRRGGAAAPASARSSAT